MKNLMLLTTNLCWLFFPIATNAQNTEYIQGETHSSPERPHNGRVPANDNCAGATFLSLNAPCVAGTTNNGSGSSTQAGETVCVGSGGGCTAETVWYRFNATSTNMVLGFVQTNSTNCPTQVGVFGPFAPVGGCLPNAASNILCQSMGAIDPGFHPQLTGLTVGQDYLVQVEAMNGGGSADRFSNFCMSINSVAANNTASAATNMNSCGTAFAGTTRGGHSPSGTGTRGANLDNNTATTCPTCTAGSGDDVPFVVNNDAWFRFCPSSAGTWNVALASTGSCILSAPNQGIQGAILTGTTAALTFSQSSPNPLTPGNTWTSSNFAVAAGQCAYVVVDGFAGDECNYTMTLSCVGGGCCVLLSSDALKFRADYMGRSVDLHWTTEHELNVSYYELEKSTDGTAFYTIATLPGAGTTEQEQHYGYQDGLIQPNGYQYYRIKQVNLSGYATYSEVLAIEISLDATKGIQLTPNPTKGDIAVDWIQTSSETVSIAVFNMIGQPVIQQIIEAQVGKNSIKIPTTLLGSGVYGLQLKSGNITRQVWFVKE